MSLKPPFLPVIQINTPHFKETLTAVYNDVLECYQVLFIVTFGSGIDNATTLTSNARVYVVGEDDDPDNKSLE